MSDPQALFDELVRVGLDVHTVDGWETRGGIWADGGPVGIMQHHTAPPVPFPLAVLAGVSDGRIRCNVNTKADGTVVLVAYGAPNYSSGSGSGTVLSEVRSGIVPADRAKVRGLVDTTNGNPYFFGFENDHNGDGSPIPAVQLDAIVRASAVVLAHFGLRPSAHISHSEWTRRKFDPYWNGDLDAVRYVRRATEEVLMGTYRGVRNIPTDSEGRPLQWAKDVVDWATDESGLINDKDDVPEDWNRPMTYGAYWTQEYRSR